MLFSRRKRQEELRRLEAAGEVLWSSVFDTSARTRLVHGFKALSRESGVHPPGTRLREAQQMVCADLGVFALSPPEEAQQLNDAADDLLVAVMTAEDDLVATIIEAVYAVTSQPMSGGSYGWQQETRQLATTVRTVLAEHRIAYDFIDGRLVPFESRTMHAGIVEPALTLLGGRAGWESVELAYRKALEEIGEDPADAITDAGTALQEALVHLGCSGNALGALAKSATGKGVLSGHDQKIVDWVAADRSQTGDTHNAKPAQREDAWLAVHVVGALLLRLASGTPRTAE